LEKIATRQLRHRILTDGIDIPRFGNHSRIVTTNAVPSAKISQTNFATVSDQMFPDGGQKCHLSVSGASA
jgi:hypothetical protein